MATSQLFIKNLESRILGARYMRDEKDSLFFLHIIVSLPKLPITEEKEKALSYMDSKSPSNKESKEVAREYLIAISNSSPEKILDSNSVSEQKKSDGVARPNCDQDDKFRSELISISYVESPDVKI